jgi:hypothetical protein
LGATSRSTRPNRASALLRGFCSPPFSLLLSRLLPLSFSGADMDPEDLPIDDENDTEACPTCGGTGLSDEDGFPCEDCDGMGYVEI